jgi:hypothetical protein
MAKYNPFAEKAGLQKITEQKPAKSILAIAALLSTLGFNLQLLGSENYISQRIDALSSLDRDRLKRTIHQE